jgi:ribosomal protein L16 Arg81 hydroxylase
MPTFADFIAPFDPVEFKTQYYGKKPLHIRAQSRSRDNPLPWARFNEVLGLTPYWNEETLKVFYKNRPALRENYCDSTRIGENGKAPADPRKVRALLGLGASLVANHVHNVCPEVAAISQMLQREFAAACGANVYCSFKEVQAFGTHFDLHDVFALQSEGEKLWRVYESRADNPTAPLPSGEEGEKWLVDTRGKVLVEVPMRPGDILYLPRGQYHDAITGAGASLHVTYWLKPATGLSLFKLLESALESESEFRAYLPDAEDAVALKQHLARLSRHLERLLNSPSFAVDIRNHQRSFATSPAGFELPVQRRPQFYATTMRGDIVRREEGFVAVFGQAALPLGNAHSAVAWLLTQRFFSFENLAANYPFIDEAELRGVVQQLVRIGAIVETEIR